MTTVMEHDARQTSLIERAGSRLARTPAVAQRSGRTAEKTPPASSPSPPNGTPQKEIRHISLDRLRDNLIITPDVLNTRLTEEFRLIKRAVLSRYLNDQDSRRNLVMVTSALPGEGKTFTALNVSMNLALEQDFRVLLVDCDLINPSIMRILDIKAQSGLIDVLTDESTCLADVLIRTDVEGLTLLPPGGPHPRGSELLGSKKMGQIMDELAGRYPDRMIIFDAPPLLVSMEAVTIAHQVGQILFVVGAERTSRETVEEGLEMIADCPNIGLVLNGARDQWKSPRFGTHRDTYYKNATIG